MWVTATILYSMMRQEWQIRAKQEAEIRTSEAQLRLVVKNSPDSVFIQDESLHYVWISNPPAPLSQDSFSGKTDNDIFLLTQAQELIAIKQKVIQTGLGAISEGYLTLGGEDRYYEWVFEPHYDHLGQIHGLIGYARDLTERKRFEESLKETNNRILSILESISDAFFSLDENFRVTYFNQAAARDLLCKPDEVLDFHFFNVFPEMRNSIFETSFCKALREQQPFSFETYFCCFSLPKLV